MDKFRCLNIVLVVALMVSGCSIFPQSRFDEAHQSLPEIRAYALKNLKDLTPEEREIIETREPKMSQANYVIYYFSWQDLRGKKFATVEASPPPCIPQSAHRSGAR